MLPFACKDVASEPPTTVIVVDQEHPYRCSSGDVVFTVDISALELTEGWTHREGKPNLTICFMHSFGKCSGRTGGDPSTCYQVHLKREVLSELRRHYEHPHRPFFLRMVHSQLSDQVRQKIALHAKKDLKMQYLDYRVQDVALSSGLLQYEAAYRRWLFGPEQGRDVVNENTVYQCENYALCGWCPNEEDCLGIHAPLNKARVRDQAVANALNKLTLIAQAQGSLGASFASGSGSAVASYLPKHISSDYRSELGLVTSTRLDGHSSPTMMANPTLSPRVSPVHRP